MNSASLETPEQTRVPRRVLLVDDDPTQLKLARLHLEDAGFVVSSATGADEAICLARVLRPAAVLSDVLMGDLDGFALCRHLRDDPALAAVPVILMSAHYGDEPARGLAKNVGAFALVARTPDFDAALEALAQSLEGTETPAPSTPGAAIYEQHVRTNGSQIAKLLKKAQSAEERYRTMFDTAGDAITVLTPEGVILEANERWRSFIGVDPASMVGRHIRDFAPPGAGESNTADFYEGLTDDQRRARDVPIRRADGSVMFMEFSLSTVEIDGMPAVISIGRDVTEYKQLEEKLRQAQKMEVIGQLTSGVAHDFNNILTPILANAHFLVEDLLPGDPRRADAQEIIAAAERAAALTRQLLAFSRHQTLQPKLVDLNGTVLGLERMLRRLIGEDVDLTVAIEPQLGMARVDVVQIEQVIMNLVVNARDAMPDGGRLTIETANVDVCNADAGWCDDAVDCGRYIRLVVRDTGSGMSADTISRIFEPFFTTKEPGKGTGLGLSTCNGIVKQSGGCIRVSSAPGRGTTFQVYLPRVDGRVERANVGAKQPTPGESQTIMLVEDDDQVRAAVTRMLQAAGHRVLCARDGSQALAIARQHAGPVHLILCDMVLPGASGPEIVERLRTRLGAAKTLFMSGYGDHAVLRKDLVPPGTSFIQKPFAPDILTAKLREVLDA
jgi:PAS domain S-box-containing protein